MRKKIIFYVIIIMVLAVLCIFFYNNRKDKSYNSYEELIAALYDYANLDINYNKIIFNIDYKNGKILFINSDISNEKGNIFDSVMVVNIKETKNKFTFNLVSPKIALNDIDTYKIIEDTVELPEDVKIYFSIIKINDDSYKLDSKNQTYNLNSLNDDLFIVYDYKPYRNIEVIKICEDDKS